VRARWLVLLSLLLVGALIGLASVSGRDTSESSPRYVKEHPVAIPADLRTISISSSMPMPSAHARRLSSMLEAGRMPHGATTGEVLTDTECAPDAKSISRCRNEVRLQNGETVVLRHPHRMAEVPCLAPGETVRLLPTAA
jgi:hypothetical protein